MRSSRAPWPTTCATLGAILVSSTTGCGGQGSTSTQSGATSTGAGGGSSSTTTGTVASSSTTGTGGAVASSSTTGTGGAVASSSTTGTGGAGGSSSTTGTGGAGGSSSSTGGGSSVSTGGASSSSGGGTGGATSSSGSGGTGGMTTAVCGDGVIEGSEQCDLGAQNGAGQGCSAACQFDCQTSADCTSANPCVGDGTCATGTANGQTIQKCQAGADVARCQACPGGFCDGAGKCNASACGDGCIDTSKGEQCDDGNLFNLDGCDATCKYEVVARMTAIAISGTSAPAALGCTPGTNRLGAQALTSVSLGVLNSGLTTDIGNGTVNVMTQLIGLTDLTGVSSAPFTIGVLDATFDPAKGKPVNNPVDWWFLADPATVSMGLPRWSFTNATLAARNLNAGPSNITLMIRLGGSPEQLAMLGAHIAATINGAPAPDAPAPPPAALAPGLTVFQTMAGNGAGQGLCGNVTVASLAASPVPSVFAQGGSMACNGSRIYTPCTGAQTPNDSSCNSLLDVLVGGCSTFGGLSTVINAIQPDVPAGAKVTPLALGTGNKVPVATTMNDDDAYSAYLTFTANRAHFTGETCTAAAECQTGLTCTAGVCK